ncbi:MAG: ABC transporter permease [Microthrixaceae bacterium]
MSVVLAVLRRDWAIERTYQLRLVLRLFDILTFVAMIYFMSLLIDDPDSLARYDGNYFDFALVGLAVTSFAGVGLLSFGESLGREQSTGTIDLLLASPASIPQLMSGMFALPLVMAFVQFVALLGIGVGLFGSGLPIGGVLMSLPILALTTASFAAVGIVIGGIMLIVKRGDPISGPFYQLSMILSGVIIPIDVLPMALRVVSWCLPATWGIRATREVLLADAGLLDVLPDVAVLAAFVVVLLPAAVFVYRACLRIAVREGVLGSY